MNLEGVEKTMLLTLFTKAKHSQERNHKFFDPKAIEVISEIDYDFTMANKDYGMHMGVIGRTILLDDMVSKHIRSHPSCTIVNIACGMDTRFNRIDNGIIRWYNIDLENVVDFRQQYIVDSEREKTLAYSAMDPSWASEIEAEENVLFILEGLVMYLSQEDMKKILDIIDNNFKSATVFVEMMPPYDFDVKSVEETDAKFSWCVEKGDELERLNPNFKWIEDRNLFEGVTVYKPITKLISWIPSFRRKMDYISVLKKY